MKKTYFAPETVIVKLQSKPIMNMGSIYENEATKGASNFSREERGSIWDDDEEE